MKDAIAILVLIHLVTFQPDTIGQTSGSIYIKSNPQRCDIYLDGQKINQQTPCFLRDLSTGRHLIRLEKDGYDAWDDTLMIKTNQVITVEANLPDGSIYIQTVPDGCAVTIDNMPLEDSTPCLIKRIPPGKHVVRLEKEGYKPWQESVTVEINQVKKIQATLKLPSGAITVIPFPLIEGEVFLDYQYRGKTPITLKDIFEGHHMIELKYEDRSWIGYVNVAGEETKILNIYLSDESKGEFGPSRLTLVGIHSDPEGARIIIDGNPFDLVTPVDINLTEGSYRLMVISGDSIACFDTLTVEEDDIVIKKNYRFADCIGSQGRLLLRSEYPDSKVYYFDDETRSLKMLGIAPIQVSNLSFKTHLFYLRHYKEGELYQAEFKVEVEPFFDNEVTVTKDRFQPLKDLPSQ